MSSLSNVLINNQDRSLLTIIPHKQLLNQSLQVVAPNKPFAGWSEQNHAESYGFMQRIAQAWKSSNFTNQYLMYGKIGANPFTWDIVPYQKCRTLIGRIIQQLVVLCRTLFGGFTASLECLQKQMRNYQLLFSKMPLAAQPTGLTCKGNDAFCRQDTLDRQWVITGKKVNVLYNYAPIGFGGERLHFLVVPKEHREAFTDVSQEEYCESLALTSKLVNHFTTTRKTIKNVYLLHKTGEDAGQTQKHWHLNVIFSTSSAQDLCGKITVLKNILFGSSPMRKDKLEKTIDGLKKELAHV